MRPVPVEEAAQQRSRGIDLVDMSLRFGAHGELSLNGVGQQRASRCQSDFARPAARAVRLARLVAAGGRGANRVRRSLRPSCCAGCLLARRPAVPEPPDRDRRKHAAARSAAGTLPRSPRTSGRLASGSPDRRAAGGPVDADPADSRRSDERHLGLILERRLRPVLEDRRGDAAALGMPPMRRGWSYPR